MLFKACSGRSTVEGVEPIATVGDFLAAERARVVEQIVLWCHDPENADNLSHIVDDYTPARSHQGDIEGATAYLAWVARNLRSHFAGDRPEETK